MLGEINMDFYSKINSIYQKNQNIEIYLDMDGTIVEFLLDNDNNFLKDGEYLKKKPISPILDIMKKIKEKYPLIKFKILSCAGTNQMKKEKNEWIDKYIPYICNEDRIIFSKFLTCEASKFSADKESKNFCGFPIPTLAKI